MELDVAICEKLIILCSGSAGAAAPRARFTSHLCPSISRKPTNPRKTLRLPTADDLRMVRISRRITEVPVRYATIGVVLGLASWICAQEPTTIRVPVRLVTVPPLVFSSDNRLIPDLLVSDFRVTDNGHPQSIRLDVASAPVSVAVVICSAPVSLPDRYAQAYPSSHSRNPLAYGLLRGSRRRRLDWHRDARLDPFDVRGLRPKGFVSFPS